MLQIYQDSDGDLALLKGKKVAVIGYGSQGAAQACMLRDSNIAVLVGVRKGGDSWKRAKQDGHEVVELAEAARQADIIHILLPDEVQAEVYDREIKKFALPGKTLSFSHGFSMVYGRIKPPRGVDIIMVAPIAPGSEARQLYLEDKGVPAYIAVYKNESSGAFQIALALAKAMKFTKAGVMEVSFEQETFTDLFGEQVVVCGGLTELIRSGFDVLVGAGYPQEMAYFECLHQVELIARLLRQGGIGGMWNEVSNTAEYGGRMVGPQIVGEEAKDKMKEMLKRIESGRFARDFMHEVQSGMPDFSKLRKADDTLPIEVVGEKIRRMLKK